MRKVTQSRTKATPTRNERADTELENSSLGGDQYRSFIRSCHRELVVLSALSTARCVVSVSKLFGISERELHAAFPILGICKRDAGVSPVSGDAGRKVMQERLVAGLAQAPTYFAQVQQRTPVVARQKAQALVTHLVWCLHDSPENRAATERLFNRAKRMNHKE